MALALRTYTAADLEPLRSLVGDPSLAPQFEILQGPHALEGALADPYHDPRLHWLGFVDGALAGFCAVYRLTGFEGRWAMTRLGVREPFRRRGLASALIEASATRLPERWPGCHELCLGAWLPSAEAASFAARHGFRHARYYWLMECPNDRPVEIHWPAGIETRVFDGSLHAFEDWNDAYNASFAEHYHGVRGTVADTRALMARPDVRADSCLLAYRGDRCVGFCRNDLYPARGEVAILGTVPEARGIGLGRALLRWGVQWLQRAGAPRITLIVDGENESALRLYRSEGFETVRTREIWSRPMGSGPPPEVATHG